MKGIHHDHCLSYGGGGGCPLIARSEGVAVPVPKAKRGRESGRPQRPERASVTTLISESSCGCESLSATDHIEQNDNNGVRSGKEKAKARSL